MKLKKLYALSLKYREFIGDVWVNVADKLRSKLERSLKEIEDGLTDPSSISYPSIKEGYNTLRLEFQFEGSLDDFLFLESIEQTFLEQFEECLQKNVAIVEDRRRQNKIETILAE